LRHGRTRTDKGIIESKRDIYRAHPLVRQDRLEIAVDRRTDDGWRSQVLHAADELTIPEFGLTCLVRDVYRDTPLRARFVGLADSQTRAAFIFIHLQPNRVLPAWLCRNLLILQAKNFLKKARNEAGS
jgi:hypothetical protein